MHARSASVVRLSAIVFALFLNQVVSADGMLCEETGRLGHTPTYFDGNDIVVHESIAYVAAGRDVGVQIFDVSDPQSIRGLNSYDSSGTDSPYRIGYHNELLYQFDRFRSMKIFDVSDPYAPVRLSFIGLPDRPFDFQFVGDQVFVACRDCVVVFDISDPHHPVEEWLLKADDLRSIYVLGTTMYLGSRTQGLKIFDISNPDEITELGEFDPPELVTDTAYIDSTAFLGDESGQLRIFDISNPASPQVVGVHELEGVLHSIEIDGDRLYVTSSSGQLFSFDITEPKSPVQVGVQNLYGQGQQFVVMDSKAYVLSNQAGLEILDVESPPTQVPPLLSMIDESIGTRSFALYGETAILASTFRLDFYDISQPSVPELLFTMPLKQGPVRAVAVDSGSLFVSSGSDLVEIYDLTGPAGPEFVTMLTTQEIPEDVISDSELLIVRGDDLHLYDVTDPSSPLHLGSMGYTRIDSFELNGDFLFVCGRRPEDSVNVFRVYSVSDPVNPVVLEELFLGEVDAVCFESNVLAIAQDEDVFVYRMIDGSELQAIAGVQIPGYVDTMNFETGRLLIVSNRLVIMFDLNDPRYPRFMSSYHYQEDAIDIELLGETIVLPLDEAGALLVDASDQCFLCPADLNGDGAINFFDVSAFLVGYQGQSDAADWNGDGLWNFFDVSGFLKDYQGGCP